MGFVLLGIGAVDALGISGAMLQMISHGLIAAAMFFITGRTIFINRLVFIINGCTRRLRQVLKILN